MTLFHTMLAVVSLLPLPAALIRVAHAATVVSSGTLKDLGGTNVGRVSIEWQEGRAYVHVANGEKAAGATLELLVSTSVRDLKAGDHAGPGENAVRVGTIERAEVRYVLPASVQPASLRSVWVWCHSVRLPSARARLTPSSR